MPADNQENRKKYVSGSQRHRELLEEARAVVELLYTNGPRLPQATTTRVENLLIKLSGE